MLMPHTWGGGSTRTGQHSTADWCTAQHSVILGHGVFCHVMLSQWGITEASHHTHAGLGYSCEVVTMEVAVAASKQGRIQPLRLTSRRAGILTLHAAHTTRTQQPHNGTQLTNQVRLRQQPCLHNTTQGNPRHNKSPTCHSPGHKSCAQDAT